MLSVKCFLTILLSFLFTSEFGRVVCSVETMAFYRNSSFNDKICVGSEKHLEVYAGSAIYCAHLCRYNFLCTSLFYSTLTSTCTLCSGHDALQNQTGTLFYVTQKVMPVLDGKTFKIYAKENNEFWHYNGAGSARIVSSLAQPDDSFVRFIFHKQLDGSYKIESLARPAFYMYDGYNVQGAPYSSLHGRDIVDDDNMRYIVTMVTEDTCRIQTKASGRYVRLDEDKYVTSKLNIIDNRSLFILVES